METPARQLQWTLFRMAHVETVSPQSRTLPMGSGYYARGAAGETNAVVATGAASNAG